MWRAVGTDITMTAGDWGVALPVTVTGTTLTSSDKLALTVVRADTGATVLEKEFTNITDNTVDFELTAAESANLTPGEYRYNLDWYQDGVFLCCLVGNASFRVVSKA